MDTQKLVQEIFSLREVADILKLTERTLHRYIAAGTLPATKVGRKWRVKRETLDRVINGEIILSGKKQNEECNAE